MLIVTGTKRSGTSMWMQILDAAGFEVIGDAFPGIWGQSIRDANPKGFYESRYRQGIYYVTNPNPETGAFMHPKKVKKHAVKVFIPGLLRTDYAFIGAVISTMRNWREYSQSLTRLYTMEETYKKEAKARGETLPKSPFPDEETEIRMKAGRIPPALEWWFENYDLIRDVTTRRYPFHMTTYDRLLGNPEGEISKVFKWLGQGDLNKALEVIQPKLRTQSNLEGGDELVAEFADIFDEFYDSVNRSQQLTASFIEKLNETNGKLTERWREIHMERMEAVKKGLRES